MLYDVVIGVGFHWERREDQRFAGELRFLFEGGRLTAVNVVPVETYLQSVISSEMSAEASPALLRAHAVISRSWLLAQLKAERGSGDSCAEESPAPAPADHDAPVPEEIIRWYDHDDHVNYDVCADDHCQRYQGITRQTTPAVAEAVEAVRCHCRATATAPLFSAVPADRLDELLDAAGGRADVVPLPDWADYLYDIGTLATLSGKRMMRKRNHFNRFIAANPDYRLQPLTEANSREALAFMTSAEPDDKPDFDSAAIALYEYDQSRHVLDHLEAYPFEGALLRGAGGEIAALAVGEVIGEVLYAHIEKMRHDVPGAGAAIMKLFCADMQRRHPALRYVNREEDCGDAGLRKAKLDLHPLAILHKYDVRLKD